MVWEPSGDDSKQFGETHYPGPPGMVDAGGPSWGPAEGLQPGSVESAPSQFLGCACRKMPHCAWEGVGFPVEEAAPQLGLKDPLE